MSKILEIISGPRTVGDHKTMLALALKSDQEREVLFEHVLTGDLYQKQRCSHVLLHVARKAPDYFDASYIERLHKFLIEENDNSSVARNVMCVIKDLKITPEKWQSKLFDYCLGQISNPSNPKAVVAFAADIAIDIAKEYEELILELEDVLSIHDESDAMSIKIKRKKLNQIKASFSK